MESIRFTTEDRHSGQGTLADVANVEHEVAKLFEQFKLDLKEMLGRSVEKCSLGDEATHLMTPRIRAR